MLRNPAHLALGISLGRRVPIVLGFEINRAGHQGELQCRVVQGARGGLSVWSLVEDRCALWFPETQQRCGSLNDLLALGSVLEVWVWGSKELSPGKEGKQMTLSQPSLSPTGQTLEGASSETLHLPCWHRPHPSKDLPHPNTLQ